ncbi:hypothetical protein GE061_007586 [Apolygus lucorum]|uniref:Uncharacterized protein n=1 Tax=Apolygus lucorum TaxID=248454 RepID=A0A6A4J9Y6_APOLU|nr:hypothetical protein GE061_007586 [Apolygus lucorum]
MVTIQVKKDCDFDTRPDLDEPRQNFSFLKNLIANHHDTTSPGSTSGSFLIANTALMKRGNLNALKFEESQKEDEGNRILETRVSVHPNVLIMYINLSEIGIIEGRGSYEIRPDENGLWLQAQELECYKNSAAEEAHAVKRKILRYYKVHGGFDWKNLISTLLPDGTLYIAVNPICHPGRPSFPSYAQGPTYSSLAGRPDFPASDPTQTFSTFAQSDNCLPQKCGNCGKFKSAGVQTCFSDNKSSSTQTWGLNSSWAQTQTLPFSCTCAEDSMELS